MDKIVMLNDVKNFRFYFRKYWNSFINSKTPKIKFRLNEFLEKMKDDDYLRIAINKMEYQDRIISCQYIKKDNKNHGFANFFLLRLPYSESLCCSSNYYFIYKSELNVIENSEGKTFLPARSVYRNLNIESDSLDYLANFAVEINENDYIYCLNCEKLIPYNEIFKNNIVKLDV